MNGEQIYNPVDGINRMIVDIEGMFGGLVYKLHPVFRLLSIVNIYLVIAVFLGLLAYMIFVRKHTIRTKLNRPTNYFAALILLLLYALLTEAPISLGPDTSFNFGLVVMPLAAKLFGPILTCAFGMLQYGTSFVMHAEEAFNVSALLVAGISGMIYGWIIYANPTNYLRCLKAKILVNIVCNIVLVPMISGNLMTAELASDITHKIVTNILLAPLQSFAIFVALLIMRKLRYTMDEVSWDFARK